MKTNFKWIFTLFLALFIQFAFAQEKTVTGSVSDSAGPIAGVTVSVKGTTRGTSTSFDGRYSIKANVGEVLEFSFIGYKKRSITVKESNSINITLEDDQETLAEVVVEGYRSTTRTRSNIASTTITTQTIKNRPNASFVQTLQGQVPGLSIATGSGSPGSANTTVILRGIGSVNGNIGPLYVIDGIPATQANFRSINPNDIESISVLKDAGATSIYGNRGANGVILIKTKRGSYDAGLTVNYSSVTGFTSLQEQNYRITNAKQLLGIQNQLGAGFGASLTQAQIDNFAVDTNWIDVFFNTGISNDHNLSFTNGGKNVNTFTSFGYFDQQGIVKGTDIKRFTFRNNTSGKSSNGKFNYAANINASFSKRNQLDQETRADINGNVLQNPLQGGLLSLPFLDPKTYVDGPTLLAQFGQPAFGITPFMLLDYLKPGNITNQFQEIKLLANASLSYKLTNDFTFRNTSGIDYTQNTRLFARNPQSYLAVSGAAAAGTQFGGLVLENFERDYGFTSTTSLNYNKVFADKHTFDASLFTEYFKANRRVFQYQQNGLDPRTSSPGAGTGYVPFNPATPNIYRPTVAAVRNDAGLFSYFGTLDYDYDSRFGFGASVRRDASYRFTDEYKWGTFYSLSGRWNIDKESFMQNTIFNELILRGSYGTAGNQNIAGASIYAGSQVVRDLYTTGTGYSNGPSLFVSSIANDQARWETITQANVGLSFVINRRLRGSVDVYQKDTKDLYQNNNVSNVNSVNVLPANLGDLRNSGVELLAAYDIVKSKNFNLTLNFNGSYNDNKFTSVPRPEGFIRVGTLQINEVGGPINQYFVVKYAGVNPSNGNLLFRDINGNLTENPTDADKVANNKSAQPRYQGAFGFEANYKGFFATTQFTYVADVYRFDFDLDGLSDPTLVGNFPLTTDVFNAWTPDNRVTDFPSLTATNIALGSDFSDRFLRDASYVRLRFATVGYNFPTKALEKTFLSGLRVYGQAENILTFTKWRGFDPESNAASTFGGYPTPKIVSFGIDLQF